MRVVSLVLFAIASFVSAGNAQQNLTNEQRAEMMRQLKLIGPGPEHQGLTDLAGQWNVTMWMGKKDMEFNGSATASMILGGRFLVIDGRGRPSGEETEFRYTIGFDRRHDEYVIHCLDTSGTYPVSARGKGTKTEIRLNGTDDDPMMKQMGYGQKKFAFEIRVVSPDEFSIETIYVDTRTKPEKDRPAFRYVFRRK